MSVWPSVASANSSALRGVEGELVSVSVAVAPRDLESLLQVLAELDFPINPQIYHDAAVIYVHRDGSRREEPATIVEFPAYAGHLPKMRGALEASGFAANAISVSPMLDEMHSPAHTEPAPPSASYSYRIWRKRPDVMTAGTQ
ncbi:MAG TPA: hypothetical protein VJN43_00545 [Bryobacteraceae bacterium]|nr:hypothetical protein [Bryobacteraceae bacterium]